MPDDANSLDPDETPSYSDNIFTNFEQHRSTLKIEADEKLADDNLFGGLRVNWPDAYIPDLCGHVVPSCSLAPRL